MDVVVHANPLYLTFAIGTAIPFLIALVTKASVSSGVRAGLSIFLSALAAVLVQIHSNGDSFVWGPTLVLFATTFLTSLGTYLGFWQPVVSVNEHVAPDFGLGK